MQFNEVVNMKILGFETNIEFVLIGMRRCILININTHIYQNIYGRTISCGEARTVPYTASLASGIPGPELVCI